MDDSQLRSLLASEIENAAGQRPGDLSEQRRKALDYYLGAPLGNEIEGRSKVVATTVSDAVEWIMPSLMKIFMGGEKAVQFEAQGPGDEAGAKQATEYVNWILTRDNNGYVVLETAFKDALIQKNGIGKVWWEEKKPDSTVEMKAVPDESYMLAESDPDIEIVTHEEYPGEDGTPLHDYTYYKKPEGRVCLIAVPPEEFLIDRAARDIETSRFCAHKTQRTISDLRRDGYKISDEEATAAYSEETDLTVEAVTRRQYDDEIGPDQVDQQEAEVRRIWVYECYRTVDWDGDGIAERRKILTLGKGGKILENESWDGPPPFFSLSPILLPHRFHGLSVAELVMDLQRIKSTILRQILDNMYLMTNARSVVSDQVVLDDLLVARPGGIVRLKNGALPSQGHVMPLETRSFVGQAFPLLEYIDSMGENRTGVTRYNQGLHADSLNKTASGINQIMGAAQQRMEAIARRFAETGIKDMFRLILKCVSKYQNKPRMIRLRDAWVPIDPRQWEHEFDMTVTVGIGMGDRQHQVANAQMLLQLMTQAITMQGGISGPLIGLEHVYNAFSRLIEAMGYKEPTLFVATPGSMPPSQPPPNPDMMKVQAQAEADKAKLQLDMQKSQAELQLKAMTETEKLKLEREIAAAELELERQKAELEAQQQIRQTEVDISLKADRQNQEMSLKRDVAESKAKPAMALHIDGREMGEMADGLGQLVTQIAQNQQTFMQMQAERDARQDQMMAAILQSMAGPKIIDGVLPSGAKFSATTRPAGNA